MPAGLDGNVDPIRTNERDAVIAALADAVGTLRVAGCDRVVRVAIDGVDGAGKSTVGDEVTRAVRGAGVTVIRSTIDSFHNPRSIRWQRGRGSAAGFYRDSHDLARLAELLLDPLSATPLRPCVVAAFDEPSDMPITPDPVPAHAGDVLIFDGIFLQRPELRDAWDLIIFVDGAARVTAGRIDRAVANCPAGPAALLHLVWWWVVLERYVGGQRLYFDAADPIAHADIVVDNNDLRAPRISADRRVGPAGRANGEAPASRSCP